MTFEWWYAVGRCPRFRLLQIRRNLRFEVEIGDNCRSRGRFNRLISTRRCKPYRAPVEIERQRGLLPERARERGTILDHIAQRHRDQASIFEAHRGPERVDVDHISADARALTGWAAPRRGA